MRTTVTLLSRHWTTIFSSNTASDFTNLLPSPIYPRREANSLYVKPLNICVPLDKSRESKVIWVFLSQLESDILRRPEQDHCLGQLKLDPETANKDSIQFHEFQHSSYHRVSDIPLYKLSIQIRDEDSNLLVTDEDSESSITLEIMDEIETGDHFEVVGTSLPYDESENVFPNGRLVDFTIPLPYEVVLDDTWEVALVNMTIPPNLVWRKYWMEIGEELIYVDVSEVRSPRAAAALITNAVSESNYSNILQASVRSPRSGQRGSLVLQRNRLAGGEEDPYPEGLTMRISSRLMILLNEGGIHNIDAFEVSLEAGKYIAIALDIDLDETVKPAFYDPLALIHCDAVRPNIVAGDLKSLIQVMPMGQYIHSKKVGFFQPKNLIYKDALNKKMSSINIRIKDSQDHDYPIQSKYDGASISLTLKFRRKQNIDVV